MIITRKVLVDDLGRVIGRVKSRTGKNGNSIEYGVTRRDGTFDIAGIATIERQRIEDFWYDELIWYDGNTGERESTL
jgi:hypothetical protein